MLQPYRKVGPIRTRFLFAAISTQPHSITPTSRTPIRVLFARCQQHGQAARYHSQGLDNSPKRSMPHYQILLTAVISSQAIPFLAEVSSRASCQQRTEVIGMIISWLLFVTQDSSPASTVVCIFAVRSFWFGVFGPRHEGQDDEDLLFRYRIRFVLGAGMTEPRLTRDIKMYRSRLYYVIIQSIFSLSSS
jgi:hypothetical protein